MLRLSEFVTNETNDRITVKFVIGSLHKYLSGYFGGGNA